MSDFKAKMHLIQFRLGRRAPNPAGGAYSTPRPLAGFKGPTSEGYTSVTNWRLTFLISVTTRHIVYEC